jgi:hypothetical protein
MPTRPWRATLNLTISKLSAAREDGVVVTALPVRSSRIAVHLIALNNVAQRDTAAG